MVDENVCLHQIDDELWQVYLGPVLLGFIDITRIEQGRLRI